MEIFFFLVKDLCVCLSMQPLCVHVRARCPHLTAHLRAEPCQTTNQAIHHLSTCRPPLRVRRLRAHACQELVFISVRKRGLWKQTINKLISRSEQPGPRASRSDLHANIRAYVDRAGL